MAAARIGLQQVFERVPQMKKIALAATAVSILMTGAASAADMAPRYTKAPPPPVVVASSWAGFYIGGNFGAGWADTNFSAIPVTGDHFLLPGQSFSTGNGGTAGWVGGVQGGYNWQWDRIVLGLEGTYSGANIKNSTGFLPDLAQGPATENILLNSKIDQYATIVGRLGFAPTNDWLLYAKGGYAAGRISTNPQDFVIVGTILNHFSSASAWHNGWTAGAGVEYKVARNWVFGVEYDYYQFDTSNHSNLTVSSARGNPPAPPTFYSENVKANMSTVTARLSYLFNAGPVVARY